MANPPPPPPGWYPHDHRLRWWDGSEWTSHAQPMPSQQVRSPANAGAASGVTSTMLTEPVLQFVCQAGLLVHESPMILDRNDLRIGAVLELRNGAPATWLATELHVVDAHDRPVLLIRDKTFGTYRFVVERPWSGPIGEIVQDNVLGSARLSLRVAGRRVGRVHRENWRKWRKWREWSDFSIIDESGDEIARVTRTVETKKFPVAGKYVVTRLLMRGLPDPVASLVVASALKAGRVFSSERFD
nr:DUF2510 domain-containing protein [Rhodococcus wratislaviensis]